MPFLNQRKEENNRRNYFMINFYHDRMLPPRRGSNPKPPDPQLDAHQTESPKKLWIKIFLRLQELWSITKTHLYSFYPLKPHFNTVKLGFTGVYINFLISAENTDCGYSLEPSRRDGSNNYPQSMFWAEIWNLPEFFIWKFSFFFFFFVVKFSIYLNRRVFVIVFTNFAVLAARGEGGNSISSVSVLSLAFFPNQILYFFLSFFFFFTRLIHIALLSLFPLSLE